MSGRAARLVRAALMLAAVAIDAQASDADRLHRRPSGCAVDIQGGGVIGNVQSTMRIDAGGKVTGSGGCNRLFGTATVGGNSLAFGGIGTTRMACPPAVMQQESKFLGALGADALVPLRPVPTSNSMTRRARSWCDSPREAMICRGRRGLRRLAARRGANLRWLCKTDRRGLRGRLRLGTGSRGGCASAPAARHTSAHAVARCFSDDIAIDLGTANTLVHVVGRGIIIDEPSVVAVVARGRQPRGAGGRPPGQGHADAQAARAGRDHPPLRDGVIADFIATEEMLRQFITRAKTMLGFRRPRILICVPAGATPVERRAVYETALSAGARRVYMIEEPVAAALGAGLPIDGPQAFMVVDIGGGTTDIAVLAEGNVVQARSLRVAGNAMDEAIVRHVRRKHHLVIGEGNAERIKIEAGTALALPNGREVEIHIKGRDLRQGQPKEVVLTPGRHGRGAGAARSAEMAEFICRALEDLPPEVAAEVTSRPIVLTGGGALLDRLDLALEHAGRRALRGAGHADALRHPRQRRRARVARRCASIC